MITNNYVLRYAQLKNINKPRLVFYSGQKKRIVRLLLFLDFVKGNQMLYSTRAWESYYLSGLQWFGKMWVSRKNIRVAFATLSGMKREW
jgi:hypothetical protein